MPARCARHRSSPLLPTVKCGCGDRRRAPRLSSAGGPCPPIFARCACTGVGQWPALSGLARLRRRNYKHYRSGLHRPRRHACRPCSPTVWVPESRLGVFRVILGAAGWRAQGCALCAEQGCALMTYSTSLLLSCRLFTHPERARSNAGRALFGSLQGNNALSSASDQTCTPAGALLDGSRPSA
jgi:hypothetical protein